MSAFDVARILILLDMIAITFSPALVNLIELLLIFTVAVSGALRAEIVKSCRSYPPVRFLLAFVGWILLATSWGEAPLAERVQEIVSWRKILLFPLVLALVTEEFRKTVLILIAVVGVVYAGAAWMIGLFQDLSAPAVLMRSDVVQAIYLALSVFSLLTLLGSYRISRQRWLGVLFVITVLFLLVTIFTSTARSGYLFSLVGLCCFSLIVMQRHRLVVVAGLVASAITLLLVIPGPAQEIKRGLDEIAAVTDPAQDPEFSSMGIRIVMWDHTIEMIANKPFLGSGAGSFEIDYRQVAESRSEGWRAGRSNDPHQQFLHIAAEYGLVGLVLLVAFLGSLVFRLRFDFPSVFGLSVLLGLCATSLFAGHLSSLVEGRMFWVLVPLFLCPRFVMDDPQLPVNR
jgi:O-antigen ligase